MSDMSENAKSGRNLAGLLLFVGAIVGLIVYSVNSNNQSFRFPEVRASVIEAPKPWPNNSLMYEKCIIDEMRGLDGLMQLNVRQYCSRLYPVEKDITTKLNLGSFEILRDQIVALKPAANSSWPEDYAITKVKLGFSRVSCSSVKEQDFSEKYDFFFKGKQGVYRGVSKMPITGDYSCYRLEKIYGYRLPFL